MIAQLLTNKYNILELFPLQLVDLIKTESLKHTRVRQKHTYSN